MGILIDTGAADLSTAGISQFRALQKEQAVVLDKTRAGRAKVQFGMGSAISLGTTTVQTPIRPIVFHIFPTETPFLLCL